MLGQVPDQAQMNFLDRSSRFAFTGHVLFTSTNSQHWSNIQ